MIHPTALVSSGARIGAGVSIGAYAIVEDGVELGEGCVLHAHGIVRADSSLAARVVVHSFAVVGGPPQDFKFDENTRSGVRIGAGSILREGVTVHRSTRAGGFTVLGESCFLMACSHVAHDCQLGDRVVMANAALLAGHCHVGAGTFLGGACAVHQFCRIGEGAIVGGLSPITFDVPPFVMVAERNRVAGLNLVGLRRRGCSREVVAELKALFARVYGARNPRAEAAAALAAGAARFDEGRHFLGFFNSGKRGVARPQRGASAPEDVDAP